MVQAAHGVGVDEVAGVLTRLLAAGPTVRLVVPVLPVGLSVAVRVTVSALNSVIEAALPPVATPERSEERRVGKEGGAGGSLGHLQIGELPVPGNVIHWQQG